MFEDNSGHCDAGLGFWSWTRGAPDASGAVYSTGLVLSIDLEHHQRACERVPNFYHVLMRALLFDPRGATNSMCVAVRVNKKASTSRHAV